MSSPNFEITPIIKLKGQHFTTTDRPWPGFDPQATDADFDQWWLDCMSDSGITNLPRVPQSLDLVEAQQLSPQVLRIVVAAHLKHNSEYEDGERFVEAFSGGLLLRLDNTTVLRPDWFEMAWMTEIETWHNLALYPPSDWEEFLGSSELGSATAQKSGSQLNMVVTPRPKVSLPEQTFSINFDQFVDALHRANTQLIAFHSSVEQACVALGEQDPDMLAEWLVSDNP